MVAPTVSDYHNTILRQGSSAFRTLKNLTFIPARTKPFKNYNFGAGSYAVVFKASDTLHNIIAVRCYTTIEKDIRFRQQAISDYLRTFEASWKVNNQFLDNEITVNGNFYPILKMDWIDGVQLNQFIDKYLNNTSILSEIQSQLVNISKDLENRNIGHGDLQCGNILVQGNTSDFKLKLIDYDGMYVPALAGLQNNENGRYEFQHPKRTKATFSPTIDRFSVWVMLTALEALKYDKSLWEEVPQGGFNTGENLLFQREDFINFNQSQLVGRLYALNQPSLNFYLNHLRKSCKSSIDTIDAVTLFDKNFANEPVSLPSVPKSEPILPTSIPLGLPIDEIEIISDPSGAVVLTAAYQKIGHCPIKIDRNKFLGQSLIASNGNQIERLIINANTSTHIYIQFNTPPPISPPPDPKPEKESSSVSHFGIILSVVTLLIISVVILWALEPWKTDTDDLGTRSDTTVVVKNDFVEEGSDIDDDEDSTETEAVEDQEDQELSELKSLLLAVAAGNTDAQFSLAIAYLKGSYGLPEDDYKAFYWLKEAAEKGHVESQISIGYMYEFGIGTYIDEEQAHKWYLKAANQGNEVAQQKVDEYILKQMEL